tara:strand:+ start:155 stop:1561 length:1407 start_codon:yes stop_codon:yes gene_type:complete
MDFIVDSDDSSDNRENTYNSYDIYTPEILNDILLSKNKIICNNFNNVTLIGDIKECKIWRKSGMSFKVTNNNISFDCKLWTNKSKISIENIIENENKLCKIEGYLNCEYYYGHKYILFVTNIILENENSRLKLLKEEILKNNFHINKKIIEWHKIKKIGIISKKETQGYNDFIKQFNLDIELNLIEISLEGEKTSNETILAIDNLQSNDIIIIIRGGGATNEISNSFDNIQLFRKIKDSSIPIISAIGHEYDKGDKLLITEICDKNYSTPTTASLEIKSELITHRLKNINILYQCYITKLYKTLDDKENELFNLFKILVNDYYNNYFGGPIVYLKENENNVIINYNNKYYRLNIENKKETNINDLEIKNYNKLNYYIETKKINEIGNIISKLDNSLIKQHFKKIEKIIKFKATFNNLTDKYDETIFEYLDTINKINKVEKLINICEHLNYCKNNIIYNNKIFNYFGYN